MIMKINYPSCLRAFVPSCLTAILLTNCAQPLMDTTVDTDSPVVEAFLQEGTNTISVNVYSMEKYLIDDVSLSKPITGLTLTVNDIQLTETASGTYTLDLNEDTIREGQTYKLNFTYNGKTIEASTTIPLKVSNIKVDPETMTQSSYSWYNPDDTTEVTVTWDDPQQDYFQVYIESPNTTDDASMGVFGKRMMQPTRGNTYTARAMEFRSTGAHYIYVYRVCQDYVDLYEHVSSTDLANPVSAVTNAFGVFTSVSVGRSKLTVYAAE